MKTFKWVSTKKLEIKDTFRPSLLEITEPASIRFWAILNKAGEDRYHPIVFNKDRNGYQTIEEELSLEESMLQVEKYLMDIGVIKEGDCVITPE